ncbi:hypothetical protein BZB76_1736 [Actinomadura pelletieri DSM 43383]|uniref:DUF6879 domain-containing protein n=1 Tax=Actinomadura pelletieri DSM 43383 TaxID=1120940 RepID=A0A495QSK6_9ACTN|nr:DUF6879 family protein [Actinomadura pelletieri]RKS76381.1 hypothetical protein BZB76_1736 [Actinomadura pelletieri DSM 43383]
MGLSYEEFNALFTRFDREAIHLEMRDSYGTEIELPHMAKWAAGEPDDLEWLRDWCDLVREGVRDGKSFRRVHIVSEPLSNYQRWSHSVMQPHLDAGAEVRWMPRRRVSSVAFPGNDFWMFDSRLVVFHHYDGNGRNIDFTTSTDPVDIKLCHSAFNAVWDEAIPHSEYKPA